MAKLKNAKHEKFIQNIVKGMTQRQAYKDAFKVNYSDEAIDSKASTLFNSDKVQERYEELIKKLEDASIMSAKDRMKWLTSIIKKEYLITDKLKAVDILNKMSGEYTTKIEGNVGVTNIRVDIDE